MTLTGLIIFLLIGAVAGWLAGLIMKGGGFGLIGNIVVGVIGSLIGGWLFWFIGDWCWRTDRIDLSRSRWRNHPPRHCPADEARVAASLPAPNSRNFRLPRDHRGGARFTVRPRQRGPAWPAWAEVSGLRCRYSRCR